MSRDTPNYPKKGKMIILIAANKAKRTKPQQRMFAAVFLMRKRIVLGCTL